MVFDYWWEFFKLSLLPNIRGAVKIVNLSSFFNALSGGDENIF
jgi:hypothetical protein